MAYTKARLVYHSAAINSEFGLAYATKLFGEDVVAALPRYVKGPKKGEIKATLNWLKAESGGWVHGKGVTPKGLHRAWITTYPSYTEEVALHGTFLGRENSLLAADSSLLGPENRARYTAEREKDRAEMLAAAEEAMAKIEAAKAASR